MNNDSELKDAPADVSILTRSPEINVQVREDFRGGKACEEAGLMRKVSPGQDDLAEND